MRGRSEEPGKPRESRHDYWGVVLEAPDAPTLAGFYAGLLGWQIVKNDADFATIIPPEGVAYLAFQTSPENRPPSWPASPEAQQMMMHLDFEVSDLQAAVTQATELGAKEAQHQPQPDVRVMLDPAGHPFCLYL